MNATETLWQAARPGQRRALPILAFPAARHLGIPADALCREAELQAQVIACAAALPTAAAVCPMDLTLEAEAFGAQVRFATNDAPAVAHPLVLDEADVRALSVPDLRAARIPQSLAAVRLAKARLGAKPLLAGAIGPFSLAGRLMDVSEILYACIDEPETVQLLAGKAADFLETYLCALRSAGADGVVLAEPLAGVLSPAMSAVFSDPYVKRLIERVQTADFPVVYHNCGRLSPAVFPQLADLRAAAYHFGNAIDMADALAALPRDVLVMGNLDPAGALTNGSAQDVRRATRALLETCAGAENFVPSTGCDVPYAAPWENILAFYEAVEEGNDA